MFSVRRRKGFLTIILILFCLVYVNWFVNISSWNRSSNEIIRDSVANFVNNNENNLIIYEIIEGYDDINFEYDNVHYKINNTKNEYINLNNKRKFYLLSAKNSINNNLKDIKLNMWNKQLDKDPFLSKKEINDLLRLLYRFRVFLLDVDLIKGIKLMEKKIDIPNKFSSSDENLDLKIDTINQHPTYIKNFEKFEQINSNKKMANCIGFGVFLNSFNHLNNVNIKFFLLNSYKFEYIDKF